MLFLVPDFNDMTNVSTILRNTSNELSNSIIDQSMTYAFSVAAASLRENFYMKERLRNVRIYLLTDNKYHVLIVIFNIFNRLDSYAIMRITSLRARTRCIWMTCASTYKWLLTSWSSRIN